MLRKIRRFVFRHVPFVCTCLQFESFILDYLNGKLPTRQMIVFELHLKLCRECRDYFRAYRQTIELTKLATGADRPSQPMIMPDDMIKAIRDALRA